MVNKVRCLHCNDVIESKHGHDFKFCSCKHVFVDGGKNYKRRGWSSEPPRFAEIDEDGKETLFELQARS